MANSGKFSQEVLFGNLLRRKVPIRIKLRLDRVKKGKVKSFLVSSKEVFLNTGEKVWLEDVNYIEFPESSWRSFKKDLGRGELPKFAFGKQVFVYPYGGEVERYQIYGNHGYFLVLKEGNRVKIQMSLYLDAYSFFSPYDEELISSGEATSPIKPGAWREDWKVIRKELVKSAKKGREVVLALRDGREIIGKVSIKSLFDNYFSFMLMTPEEKRRQGYSPFLRVYSHSVEDFWEA